MPRVLPDHIRATIDAHTPPHLRQYAYQMAIKESAGNPNDVSSTGAKGLFQFTRGTGRQYGLNGKGFDNRADPAANTQAFVKFTNDNRAILSRSLGREPTNSEMALAHQQGAGTAAKMLTGTGNASAKNLRVNNVPAGATPQQAANKIMSYYGFDKQGTSAPTAVAGAPSTPGVTLASNTPAAAKPMSMFGTKPWPADMQPPPPPAGTPATPALPPMVQSASLAWPGPGESAPPVAVPPITPTEVIAGVNPSNGISLASNPINDWMKTAEVRPLDNIDPFKTGTPQTQLATAAGGGVSPSPAVDTPVTPAADAAPGGGILAGLGAKDAPGGGITGMLGGLTDIIGGLSPKPSSAAQQEAARIEPTHSNLAANTPETGGGTKLSAELMTHLLQNKRRNYGLSLTG